MNQSKLEFQDEKLAFALEMKVRDNKNSLIWHFPELLHTWAPVGRKKKRSSLTWIGVKNNVTVVQTEMKPLSLNNYDLIVVSNILF